MILSVYVHTELFFPPPSNPHRTGRQLAQQQLSVQHLRDSHDLLARTPIRHADHPVQLQRLHQLRCRRAERWCWHLFRHRRSERLALPAPLDRHRRYGRLQEQRRHSTDDELAVASVAADCLRSWYVYFLHARSMGLTSRGVVRRVGLRCHQQRRLCLVDDVLDVAPRWLLLRCH